MEVIAEASLSNRKSFSYLTCFFTVSYGCADTEEQAVARGPVHSRVEADGVWIADKEKVLYELTLSATELDSEGQIVIEESGVNWPGSIVIYATKLAAQKKL